MSFYDDASIVLIPSGYKTSKLYSQKPTDGSGDLTFTRTGSTATRVNESGLIERCRTNQFSYSQSFGNATWLTIGTTKVSTNNIDPNGGTTAANITWASGGTKYFYQEIGSPNITTISFWVKSNGANNKFRFFGNGLNAFSNDITATTTWTKYTFTYSGNTNIGAGIAHASDNSAGDILVAFAQIESGDIATDYIPTTSAAVTVGPVANLPRLDYTGGGCPKLLMEPTRTNLALYSQQFDNVAWTKENCTISKNTLLSLDNYINADKFTDSSGTSQKVVYQIFTLGIGNPYTFSVFVKKAEYSYVFLRFGGVTGNPYVIYNLNTQSIISQTGLTSTSITSFANDWFRITITTTTTTNTLAPVISFIPSTGYTLNASNIPEYSGTGTNGGYLYGAQLEAGSYATSYIPTFNASVTRNADQSITASIPALIGQTEGTFFIEFERTSLSASSYFTLTNANGLNANSYQNSIYIFQIANNVFVTDVYLNNSLQSGFSSSALSIGTHKIAIAYKQNDFALYIDGVLIGTDTSGNVPALNYLTLGGAADPGQTLQNIKQALIFKTRLSNSDLATLTTL